MYGRSHTCMNRLPLLLLWRRKKKVARKLKEGRQSFDVLKYQQGMPYSKQKGWVKQWVSMSSGLNYYVLLKTSTPDWLFFKYEAPVCLPLCGRNRKYSAAASCLRRRGPMRHTRPEVTSYHQSLNLSTNSFSGWKFIPWGLSVASIPKKSPRLS